MPLSEKQVSTLLSLIVSTEEDNLDCDGCLKDVAQFAEADIASLDLEEALQLVKRHLEQCPCCHDEYETLKVALESIQT